MICLLASTPPHPRTHPAFALHILLFLQPRFYFYADLLTNSVLESDEANLVFFPA